MGRESQPVELFATAKPNLSGVKNYKPGKPIEEVEREYGIRNAIKMASNENPLGPSPKAVAAMRQVLAKSHRYPDGGCFYLRRKLAKALSVSEESLVFGNGSDELLVFAVRAFVSPGDEIIIADPTFLIYEIAGQVENARIVKVPMKNFRYDLDTMQSHINSRTKLIFVANPDNPVGTYIDDKKLFVFLKTVPKNVIVVLDEAYYEYARVRKDYPDTMKWISTFPNLIVTRTFSKAYGLAGLRVGYAVTREPVAAALNKVREPFNVNLLAQTAATAALDDKVHLKKSVTLANQGRKYLTGELVKLGFKCVETVTNFILADARQDTSILYEDLLKQGVIVRPMSAWGLKTFIRVTIGTPAENRRFVDTLKQIMRKRSSK